MSLRREERRAREALGQVEVPDEHRAEERGRQVVAAAFEERDVVSPGRRTVLRVAISVAVAGLIAGFALTPAGAEVREWIEERMEIGEDDPKPELSSLPAPGALLVEARGGAWILRDDGSKRRLGAFDEAAWSPSGRFVAVTDGDELRAVDPAGTFRWSIDADERIRAIDWSSDEGFRVAYLVGDEVRVVTGDGATDEAVASSPSGLVGPAWQPESDSGEAVHNLTFVGEQNRVQTIDTDTGRLLWSSRRFGTRLTSVGWDAAGQRVLVVSPEAITVLDTRGKPVFEHPIDRPLGRAAISPDGQSVAFVSSSRRGAELSLLGEDGRVRHLYSSGRENRQASFETPVFSPDGEWILLPWPEADQWLFVNTENRRVMAVADIARQFDSDGRGGARFPMVAGWCC